MVTTSLAALAALRVETNARGADDLQPSYCTAPASPSRGPPERALQLSECVLTPNSQLYGDRPTDMASVINRLKSFEARSVEHVTSPKHRSLKLKSQGRGQEGLGYLLVAAVARLPRVNSTVDQCYAKCRFTGNFDRLPD